MKPHPLTTLNHLHFPLRRRPAPESPPFPPPPPPLLSSSSALGEPEKKVNSLVRLSVNFASQNETHHACTVGYELGDVHIILENRIHTEIPGHAAIITTTEHE